MFQESEKSLKSNYSYAKILTFVFYFFIQTIGTLQFLKLSVFFINRVAAFLTREIEFVFYVHKCSHYFPHPPLQSEREKWEYLSPAPHLKIQHLKIYNLHISPTFNPALSDIDLLLHCHVSTLQYTECFLSMIDWKHSIQVSFNEHFLCRFNAAA